MLCRHRHIPLFIHIIQSTKSSVRCTFHSPLGPLADWVYRLGLHSELFGQVGYQLKHYAFVFNVPSSFCADHSRTNDQLTFLTRIVQSANFSSPEGTKEHRLLLSLNELDPASHISD